VSLKSLLSLIRFFEARHLVGLWAFASLDDVELYFIAFFKALISLALDGTVMDEDIGPTVAAQETVAFSVVEPLNRTFILCHFATPFSCVFTNGAPGSESVSAVAPLVV
jgi:hypothetical protein